ncbi:hypothetical protein MPC4_250065 [Methylocella tundrae]|uniref:Uncharacterized protein n=1 Tax=Methylocella tundrae TaxID=227605 RepID=A0A8B6M6X5_METTU|nr:hypothetical protein MPC1_1620009 [Methylocella tundrae]VTZ50557.1 hypothetical protein MPC4_250065 [Methylocella tundrae]
MGGRPPSNLQFKLDEAALGLQSRTSRLRLVNSRSNAEMPTGQKKRQATAFPDAPPLRDFPGLNPGLIFAFSPHLLNH